MSGTSCLVVGFSFATENGCDYLMFSCILSLVTDLESALTTGTSPSTIALILLGLIVLVLGGVYETRTTRECLFPAATFHNLTVGTCTSPFKSGRFCRRVDQLHSYHPGHNILAQLRFQRRDFLSGPFLPGRWLTTHSW